jgi:anti-sigma B factor antagonist
MNFSLNTRRRNTDTVITVRGEIDIAATRALRAEFLRALRPQEPHLLLEMSGVTFLDCAGLRPLLEARRWAGLRGGSLRLMAASAPVRRIITLAGLEDALPREPPAIWDM